MPSTRIGTGSGSGSTWSFGEGGAAITGVDEPSVRVRMDDGIGSGGRRASKGGVVDEDEGEGAEGDNDRDWMGWMDGGGGGDGDGREGDVEMFAESVPSPNSVQGPDENGASFRLYAAVGFWLTLW